MDNRNLFFKALTLVCLLSCLVSCRKPEVRTDGPEFKMHIRLWMHHHENDTLSAQLLGALKKYP